MSSTHTARIDRRLPVASLLFAGACAQVPADVSVPSPTRAHIPAQARAPVTALPDACVDAEAQQCASACSDAECLAWCGGEQCVTALASLHACMDETEQEFARSHPMPGMESEVVEIDGEQIEQATAESMDAYFAWEDARNEVLDRRWAERCEQTCVAALAPSENGATIGFCRNWRDEYTQWGRLVAAPGEPRTAAIMATSTGLFGSFGTVMTVAGELGQQHDAPAIALRRLVARGNLGLASAGECVPGLQDGSREFTVHVALGDDSVVATAVGNEESADTLRCIERRVETALTLPIRVAREYPTLELRVRVMAAFGGLLDSETLRGFDSGPFGAPDYPAYEDHLDAPGGTADGTSEGLGGRGVGGFGGRGADPDD
jgi:hypothetical protein